jgi:tetratricopeptide (TPR) repeat protein
MKNAELYHNLHQESVSVAQDYLKKLSSGRGSSRSRFVDLYMGEALIEAGKPEAAIVYLEKFIADESIDQRYRMVAKADVGLCYYLNDDKQKAESVWNSIDSTDPEVRLELAAVSSRAGLKDKNSEALCDQSLGDIKKSGRSPSIRMMKNAVSVYVRAGFTDKGLDLLKRTDTRAYSYKEVIGKSKIISFYDLSLLGDLSTLYGQASIAHLEKAAADAAVKDAADYYLGQAYSLFGSIDRSAKIAASFVSASRMSQQYKNRIQVWQAVNLYQKGRQTDAVGAWGDLSRKQPLDPDLFADIVLACARVKAECPEIVKRAEAAVETGQGKKFYALNSALGKYYLVKKNQAKAIAYMEAGRDKSNKNKLESNDPLMLVDLAGLYYRSKKFSEALEIYFEMSKQFPAVRRIQEAMQGVYAMEQKSAGDVKIF